jgi:hypothetical protein
MKKISLKTILIAGAVFMILSGSLLHFAYELSGNNQIVGLFSAVSESVWEHSKMFLLPLFIVALIEYMKIKDISKILWAALAQLLFMICFITIFYYTYTGALGFENVIIDISSFIVAIILGQVITYNNLISKSKPILGKYLSAIALVAIILIFAITTYNPPRLPIFIPLN